MATSRKKKEETTIIDIRYINLADLLPNPYQPESRLQVDPETATKFALSIQEHGLIQTPVVRVANGHYEIADGWLRRAGFLLNLQGFGLQEYAKMPCVVRDLTDRQMADMVMETNTVRKDLNPIELAQFYKRYLEDFKVTQVELARRHNCSQGEIANTVRLLDLSEDIQGKIISQEISETHGRQLLRLNYDPELQQEMLTKTVEDGGSVNKLANDIASKIYFRSANIDPSDYPHPEFDIKECEGCPNRQRLGSPYSGDRGKKWRCVDKKCYEKKTAEVEKKRVADLSAEVAKAKEAAGLGKGKGKKGKVAVIDCANLNWRDYQELDSSQKIDNPEECKTCEHRAVGSFRGGRSGPICANVKCFQAKEKALEAKKAAATKKAEQELSQHVKAVCEEASDEASMFKVISEYLLAHCTKDPRDKFMRLYGITNLEEYFNPGENVPVLPRMAALVVQIERYQGEKGRFMRMLAELSGNTDEIDKLLADFKEKHCKTCGKNTEQGGCSLLMRVYPEGHRCWGYWEKKVEEEEAAAAVTAAEVANEPAN